MRQQMMAQGEFLEADREADDTEKTEDEVSQDAATGKLTLGPTDRASVASSEQMMGGNPQSRGVTDLGDGTMERASEGQIDSSSKAETLYNKSLQGTRLENQDTEFSMQGQSEAFFRDRVIDENA